VELKIVNYKETMRALGRINTGLYRDTRLEINRAAQQVVKKARGFVPDDPGLSGWDKGRYTEGSRWYDRAWSTAEVKREIRTYRGSGNRTPSHRGWYIGLGAENRSLPGMIYELAGTKSNGRDERGRRFIRQIASTGLRTPLRRLIVRAGVEEGPKARKAIVDALVRLERATNRVTA
jgi:hypothetical protein